MKNIHLSCAVAMVMSIAASSAHAGNDGTIEFTGSIDDVTCTIESSAPGESNANIAVDLGTISVGNLHSAGERAGARGFNIVIGGAGDTGCTNGKTVRVRFDPSSPAIDATTGRLKLDASGTSASNVQIEIANSDGTPLNVYTDVSKGVTITNNQAVIPMIGRYYATGAATAGEANSRVAFQVAYD